MPGQRIDRPHIPIGDEERYACTDLLSGRHARCRPTEESWVTDRGHPASP